MPDETKNTRLRRIFYDWRKNDAAKEKSYIDTAVLMNDYTSGRELSTIKRELADARSTAYINFEKHEKRSLGALLFAKLAIDDYHQQQSEQLQEHEAQTLKNISESLGNLFVLPKEKPSEMLDKLITNTNRWLDDFSLSSTDSTQAKDMCLAIYTMAKTIEISLTNIGFPLRVMARRFVDIDGLKRQLGELLTKVEMKVAELDSKIAETARATAVSQESTAQPTISEYVENRVNDILAQENIPLTQIINQAQTVLDNTEQLKMAKDKNSELTIELEDARSFLQKIKENGEKKTERLYALELINRNKDQFERLYEKAPKNIQDEWAARLAQLRAPSTSQRLVNAGQYALSWATAPSTIAYRALAPKSVQQVVERYAPGTLDSESKIKLKELANARINELNAEIAQTNESIKCISANLANQDPIGSELISNAGRNEIDALPTANPEINALINDISLFSQKILSNQKQLGKIANLNTNIDNFIKKHDGFAVKLSSFLARVFSSFFKTDKTKKVEDAREMLAELQGLKNSFETELQETLGEIRSNPDISDDDKADLERAISTPASPDSDSDSDPIQHSRENIVEKFNSIKSQLDVIKAERKSISPVTSEEHSNDSTAMAHN
jgi:L-fucose mutarotase/ribose pyranase (RbsD/FucU family)